MKLYGTQRYERIGTIDLTNLSLNGTYTASFFLNNQFADWFNAGLTDVKDMQIPEERYTAEIAPGFKKLTRWIECEYNEAYVDPIELQRSIENVGRRFDITIFATIEEARQWIRDNTDLVETTPGNFVLSEEYTDIGGQVVPKQYLTIE